MHLIYKSMTIYIAVCVFICWRTCFGLHCAIWVAKITGNVAFSELHQSMASDHPCSEHDALWMLVITNVYSRTRIQDSPRDRQNRFPVSIRVAFIWAFADEFYLKDEFCFLYPSFPLYWEAEIPPLYTNNYTHTRVCVTRKAVFSLVSNNRRLRMT